MVFKLDSLNALIFELLNGDLIASVFPITLPTVTDRDNHVLRFFLEFTMPPFDMQQDLNIEAIESLWDSSSTLPLWASRPACNAESSATLLRRGVEISFRYSCDRTPELFFRLTFATNKSCVLHLKFERTNVYLSPMHGLLNPVILNPSLPVDSPEGILYLIVLKRFGQSRISNVRAEGKALQFYEIGNDVYIFYEFCPRLPGKHEGKLSVYYDEYGESKQFACEVEGCGYEPSDHLINDSLFKNKSLITSSLEWNRHQSEFVFDILSRRGEIDIEVLNKSGGAKRIVLLMNALMQIESSTQLIRPNERCKIRFNFSRIPHGLSGRVHLPIQFYDCYEAPSGSATRASVAYRSTESRINQIMRNPLGFTSLAEDRLKEPLFKTGSHKVWVDVHFEH